jgi:hypothetical protein
MRGKKKKPQFKILLFIFENNLAGNGAMEGSNLQSPLKFMIRSFFFDP